MIALFYPPVPVIEEITKEEITDITDVWHSRDINPARDLIRLQDSFETLSTSCLRAARAHQLYRDGIDNVAGILATLFDDPSPSCIEDPDNPFPED